MKKDDNLKFYSNNNGYSLLIAVCALLIFSVIGLSLLTVTANGLKKNESRESNVQAIDLADKGISYAVSDLQYQLGKLIENPIGKVTFGKKLDELLGYDSSKDVLTTTSIHKYHCGPTPQNGIKIDSSKAGNYTNICIQKVEMIKTNGIVEEKDRYKRIVTFKSTGIVDGKTKETFSKVILGTDAIPDQLKYAISTNNGGNLFLHGGIEVKGDIKTAANLILADRASWGTAANPNNSNNWTESLYPKIIKNDTSVTPKIIMQEDKNIYNLKFNNTTLKSSFYKNNHIKGTSFSDTSYYDKLDFNENVLSDYLFKSDDVMIVKRKLNDDQVDIKSEFEKIPSNAIEYKKDLTEGVSNTDKNKVYHIAKQDIDPNCRRNCSESGNIIINKNASLVGKFYVDGDVLITDSNLLADAILYVKGNVKIDGSTVKGTSTDSTLFIFAEGDITFSNIYQKSGSGDPQYDLKGFYYSQSNMHILGVLSHMKFSGGVSGKDIILTGVRGIGKNSRFDSVNNQKTKEARLKIIYDENLIKQFHEFKRDEEEEFIKSINDPEIVERY